LLRPEWELDGIQLAVLHDVEMSRRRAGVWWTFTEPFLNDEQIAWRSTVLRINPEEGGKPYVSGKLTVTNQRVVFTPSRLEKLGYKTGSVCIQLGDLGQVTVTEAPKLMRRRQAVRLQVNGDSSDFDFSVLYADEAAARIRKHLWNHAP
jgi:hypothetical protein